MGLSDRTPPTPEEYAAFRERFSNWGRWGEDDELGTLNHVTPEVRRRAASLVVEGQSISLGRPVDTHAGPRNPYPAHHFAAVGDAGGLADYVGLFFHGFSQSHIDALSHIPSADGAAFYNGRRRGQNGMPEGQGSSKLLEPYPLRVLESGVDPEAESVALFPEVGASRSMRASLRPAARSSATRTVRARSCEMPNIRMSTEVTVTMSARVAMTR
jgi:hypothetical protein